MASGLSLKVLLQLQKKNFDQGLNSVKAGLASLRKTILGLTSAIVGGLGLNQLVSAFKDTAVKLSQVENTLKNVSDTVEEYEESLHFLKSIANEFGVEQNALIQSFAKFHSAAKTSNLTMQQQKEIFQSLTRAAGAFHLSADDTSHALLAVEQMLSKGRVAAEELRRQLGNTLPGAFNIMALAAGDAGITLNGTTAELDAAMRAGQVVAEEILPYFAKRLNEVTKNASFDSLQSSLNRFKNSWTEFVRNSDFTGFYKAIVDGGTLALDSLGKNFKTLGRIVVDVLAGAGVVAATKLIKKMSDIGAAAQPALKKYGDLRAELKGVHTDMANIEKQMAKLQPGKKYQTVMPAAEAKKYVGYLTQQQKESLDYLEKYNGRVKVTQNYQSRQYTLQKQLNDLDQKRIGLLTEISHFQGTSIKSVSTLRTAWIGVRKVMAGVLTTIKAIGIQMLAAFAVGVLVNFIQKLVQARKEAQRIADIPKEAEKEWHKLSEETANQLGKLDAQLAIYKSEQSSLEAKQGALAKINQLLGREGDEMLTVENTVDEITDAINKQKGVIKQDAEEIQRLAELDKVSAQINKLTREQQDLQESSDWMQTEIKFDKWGNAFDKLTPKAEALKKKFNALTKEINQLIVAQNNLSAPSPSNGDADGSDNKTVLTADEKAVKSALDGYESSLKALNNQKANGALTEKEYQHELVNTQKKVMSSISVYEGLDAVVEKLGGSYKTLYQQIKNGSKKVTGGGGKEKDPVQEAMDKYIETEHTLDNLLKNGMIDQEEYNNRLIDAAEACEEVVGAQEDMIGSLRRLGENYLDAFNMMELSKDIAEDEIKTNKRIKESLEQLDEQREKSAENKKKYNEAVRKLGEIPVFENKRDSSLDYKKDASDILGDYADNLRDYVKDLEDYRDKIKDIKEEYGFLTSAEQQTLDILEKLIAKATAGADTAQVKANLAEITLDIRDMKEELNDLNFDLIKDGVSGFEGIIGSIESCVSAFEKLDDSSATWLDHLKAGFSVLDAIIEFMETFQAITKTVTVIQELSGRLQDAQATKEILLSKAKTAVVKEEGQVAMETASEKAAAAAIEIAADEAKAKAAGKSAASNAANSVAGIPGVGPALAIAAVAGVVGTLLTAFSKFANGGIVGGSKTQGDQNVIRANSGEMILNKAQQANLFSMIKNGGTGGGSVEFKIRGADLVGTLNNYHSRLKG